MVNVVIQQDLPEWSVCYDNSFALMARLRLQPTTVTVMHVNAVSATSRNPRHQKIAIKTLLDAIFTSYTRVF